MAKAKRDIITIDEELCNGCEECITACPEQAIQIVDTPKGPKARLVKELYCDGLGACVGNCPTGALKVEKKAAEAYDDNATIERIKKVAPEMLDAHKKHMAEHGMGGHSHEGPAHGGGCPGSKAMFWGKEKEEAPAPAGGTVELKSELRQWPVQLMLVNPAAPYFKNADIVVSADCVPFAFANFHNEFLKGKSLIIACPKLDDVEFYREKLVELFKVSDPKSISVVTMEVPCCGGLDSLVQEAIKASGKRIPYLQTTISLKGEIM